jgi:D-glycero-alpha-D-manno-heptose 1-phosphate guanylyltransferase
VKEAVILAGGFGTRLRSVVGDLPKPMAPIKGKPFLSVLLRQLSAAGIERVILSLGYQAHIISDYFGSTFEGLSISYVIEDAPLGTGGAVKRCLASATSDPLLILNGDTYLEFDMDALTVEWDKHREPIIVARKVDDVGRFGSLDVRDDKVIGFCEKGLSGPGLINAGAYVFPRALIGDFPDRDSFALEADYLMLAVKRRNFRCAVTVGKFIDIGIPEDYRRAQLELGGE